MLIPVSKYLRLLPTLARLTKGCRGKAGKQDFAAPPRGLVRHQTPWRSTSRHRRTRRTCPLFNATAIVYSPPPRGRLLHLRSFRQSSGLHSTLGNRAATFTSLNLSAFLVGKRLNRLQTSYCSCARMPLFSRGAGSYLQLPPSTNMFSKRIILSYSVDWLVIM